MQMSLTGLNVLKQLTLTSWSLDHLKLCCAFDFSRTVDVGLILEAERYIHTLRGAEFACRVYTSSGHFGHSRKKGVSYTSKVLCFLAALVVFNCIWGLLKGRRGVLIKTHVLCWCKCNFDLNVRCHFDRNVRCHFDLNVKCHFHLNVKCHFDLNVWCHFDWNG